MLKIACPQRLGEGSYKLETRNLKLVATKLNLSLRLPGRS